MNEPIVYGSAVSTYVRTARMALQEKGVPYKLEDVVFRSEEHRKLHPYAKIPAFRHGDVLLYETLAITEYIDSAFEGPALKPADPVGRARTFQWISVINAYAFDALIVKYWTRYAFAKDGKPDMEAIEAAVPGLQRQLKLIDEGYGARSYLVGDKLTLADLFLAPIVSYAGSFPAGQAAIAGCPGILRGIEAIQSRESFKSTTPPPPPPRPGS